MKACVFAMLAWAVLSMPGQARTVVFDEADYGDFASSGTTLRLFSVGTYIIRGSQFSDTRIGGFRDSDKIGLSVIAPLRIAGVEIDIVSGEQPDDSYRVIYALTGTDRSGTNTLRRWQFDVEGRETLFEQRLRGEPFPQEDFTILSFFGRGRTAEQGVLSWDYEITVDVQEIAEVPLPATAPVFGAVLVVIGWAGMWRRHNPAA
ncbi:hypothetical protein [Actibacterium sp. 188UL27-1]|uniref:hypothetical protein n=1 Tax=Actibacterium sp. 188UL27-1 TaxID=2786961 RepID=UPI0019566F15|nr:hypothetical protein [Actibacterium sp. 188UL27-1]MBM7068016.1 hypothetical protein [Actibacterium sp. 188UL27-1]